MKHLIEEFCQGIYDALRTKPNFDNQYSFEDIYTIFSNAISALILKLITLILGFIACVLSSMRFQISLSNIFWVGITFWLCWFVSDEDLKRLMKFIKEIERMNDKNKDV